MKPSERILLAVGIVLADLCLFVVPVLALFSAYILISRPPWFKTWITRVYE